MDRSLLSLCQLLSSDDIIVASDGTTQIKPWDHVVVYHHQAAAAKSKTTGNRNVISMIVQVVPSHRHYHPTKEESSSNTSYRILLVHSLLFQVLCQTQTRNATDTKTIHTGSEGSNITNGTRNSLLLWSISDSSHHYEYAEDTTAAASSRHDGWIIEKCHTIQPLPNEATVGIVVLYKDETMSTKRMARLLENRVIQESTILVLSEGCIVICHLKEIHTIEERQQNCFRVGTTSTFHLELLHDYDDDVTVSTREQMNFGIGQPSQYDTNDCPGYESLLVKLQCLMQGPGRPTGIILTGCAGIGKTRLAAALATTTAMGDFYISVQDLMVRASWATEEDLLEMIVPPLKYGVKLVIIDDLQVLQVSTESEVQHTVEWILVRNSISTAIDQLVENGTCVVGIARNAKQLPPELIKAGRLEVTVTMLPPTQAQREAILESLLQRPDWARKLSGALAGCVAGDLQQLCSDATAKSQHELQWNDLIEAARLCIPSQLAQLDVTKTPHCPFDGTDYAKIHEWAWSGFGGYAEIKKRIFRTVVMPWRRYLDEQVDSFSISPPRGVLFHGVTGVGKTFAAGCLAASLGLHVVRVRASDVLDKWLGGSEAAIRSLFARARGAAPCILFFDEIDAIASNRENDGVEHDVSSRILTTFLNELDGVSSNGSSGVLVMACTNRVQDLDAALLRPGRLEEHVPLARPSKEDVQQILQLVLSKVPKDDDINLDDMAELFVELNATGADIDGVCRDACSIAIRNATAISDVKLTHSQIEIAMKRWKGDTCEI